MIIALILAGKTLPLIQNQPPFLLPLNAETAIERVAGVVLRGPFGGTIAAADPKYGGEVKQALTGFAVQHVALSAAHPPGTVGALAPALKFADDFRARWERAMAAASARFGDADDYEGDDQPKSKKGGKARTAKPAQPQDWKRHSKNADVKVRGLARSFERDGMMLFRGDCPLIRPELQAQIVEAFAREGADRGAQARPLAQAVYRGIRAFPVLFDRVLVPEILALPPATAFDDWLLNQLARTQDVPVQDSAAVESLSTDADYQRIKAQC